MQERDERMKAVVRDTGDGDGGEECTADEGDACKQQPERR